MTVLLQAELTNSKLTISATFYCLIYVVACSSFIDRLALDGLKSNIGKS